jgi:uncharacterized protein YegJ (DUF2314 family)
MLKKFYCIKSALVLSAFFVSSSCNSNKAASADNWDKQNTRSLDVTDTAYLNAVSAARNNLDFFNKLLNAKEQNHFDFFIKSRLSESSITEHLWFKAIVFKDDSFVAILDNVPKNLKKIKYKDTVQIAKNDVEDWSIYEADSLLLGNFISHAYDK